MIDLDVLVEKLRPVIREEIQAAMVAAAPLMTACGLWQSVQIGAAGLPLRTSAA